MVERELVVLRATGATWPVLPLAPISRCQAPARQSSPSSTPIRRPAESQCSNAQPLPALFSWKPTSGQYAKSASRLTR